MTRRRWIADRVAGGRAWLTGDNAAHLARVLRAKPGQQFDIADGAQVRSGTIVSVSPEEVQFELGAVIHDVALPEVSVFLSIFKFDRLEWAVEKLTELGVAQVIPVVARRTEPHLAKAAEKRVERWRKIAREATQQSRRAAPPEIAPPMAIKKGIEEATGSRLVLSELEERASLKSALTRCKPPLALAFGPEGGWAEQELQMFSEAGWTAASLGSTILRAETAAIAAVAIALAELQADSSLSR